MAATLFAAGGAIATSGPGPAGAQGEPDGEAIYQANCAVCHGVEGEGGVGPGLQGIGEEHSLDELKDVITNGRGQMPAWQDVLEPAEIDAVAAFVASLEGEHEHDDHGDDPGDDHSDGDDHGDGDDHSDGDDHGDGDDHSDGDDHGDTEAPGTGTPAPPVAGDPGFTG